MSAVPDYLQYSSAFGWAIIVALVVMSYARPRISLGPAVMAAATAAFLTKTIVRDLI